MKISALILALFTVATAWSQSPPYYGENTYQVQSEIRNITNEILQAVRSGYMTREELESVRDGLVEVLERAHEGRVPNSPLICSKGSNGQFYPTNSETGAIVGSNSYSAGYNTLNDCRASLPVRGESLTCYKQSNGLFYPSQSLTGKVIGSNSYSAGHSTQQDCRQTLPSRRSKVACYKQSNGLYYPSKPETGEVIGSNSYNAGYNEIRLCQQATNQ